MFTIELRTKYTKPEQSADAYLVRGKGYWYPRVASEFKDTSYLPRFPTRLACFKALAKMDEQFFEGWTPVVVQLDETSDGELRNLVACV